MASPRLDFHALSHRGMVRSENQDHVFAGRIGSDERYLFAVADGVGGREGGAWASERTLQALLEEISVAGSGLQAATAAANRTVYDEASSSDERKGAATTLAAALVEDAAFSWANVGDSRVYILRGGILHQLSHDHSLVEEELAAGRITAEEAANANYRNVITRSIGNQPAVDVDCEGPFELEAGDVLLLCSDGLHQLVTAAEMTEDILSMEPAAAADALIRLANQRGGPDNISVVICAFEPETAASSETQFVPWPGAVVPPPVPQDQDTQRMRRPLAQESAAPALQPPPVQPPAPASQPAPPRQPVAARERDDEGRRKSSGPGVRLIGFGIAAGATIGILIGVFLRP